MIEALHLGSMLPAALGACCVAGGGDRRSATAWVGMASMLVAMADTILLPTPLVPPVVWAGLLLVVAVATALHARLRGGSNGDGGDSDVAPHSPMAVHRSLQALLMAGLLVGTSAHAHSALGASASHGLHTGHGLPVPVLLAAASAVFAVYSARLALRRASPRLGRLEAALGGLSITAMAAAAFL